MWEVVWLDEGTQSAFFVSLSQIRADCLQITGERSCSASSLRGSVPRLVNTTAPGLARQVTWQRWDMSGRALAPPLSCL